MQKKHVDPVDLGGVLRPSPKRLQTQGSCDRYILASKSYCSGSDFLRPWRYSISSIPKHVTQSYSLLIGFSCCTPVHWSYSATQDLLVVPQVIPGQAPTVGCKDETKLSPSCPSLVQWWRVRTYGGTEGTSKNVANHQAAETLCHTEDQIGLVQHRIPS